MNKLQILVVEDDPPVRNLITTTLKAHEYRYITAANGAEAIAQASACNPDVVLLDLGLPDIDGVDVIRKLRTWSTVPIIVISARSEESDMIGALDSGADDYLTKPFSVNSSQFINGTLKVDYAAGCAYLDGEELHLTPIEYKLLCLMCQNVGKVLTHTFITQKIWGNSWDSTVASLRVFMATLRKKIEPSPDSPTFIQTHIGVGYRMLKVE